MLVTGGVLGVPPPPATPTSSPSPRPPWQTPPSAGRGPVGPINPAVFGPGIHLSAGRLILVDGDDQADVSLVNGKVRARLGEWQTVQIPALGTPPPPSPTGSALRGREAFAAVAGAHSVCK
jgi:hypothetical protein